MGVRRIAVFLWLLALSILLPGTAFAAQPPVIDTVAPDCIVPMDCPAPELYVSAHCEAEAALLYQWYCAQEPDYQALSPIDGAQQASYTPPVQQGERYYCVEVRCAESGLSVYSRLISVCFEAPWYDLVIVSPPNQLEYTCGESLNLSGLSVDIYYSGGVIHSENGEGLLVSEDVLQAPGKQEITVHYQNASGSFFITVSGPHAHSYGAWETLVSPTCTAAGQKARTCACGETQYEAIAATGHRWKGGSVCTACGAKRAASAAHAATSPSSHYEAPAKEQEASPPSSQSVQQETITIHWRSSWHYALFFGGFLLVLALFLLLLDRNKHAKK